MQNIEYTGERSTDRWQVSCTAFQPLTVSSGLVFSLPLFYSPTGARKDVQSQIGPDNSQLAGQGVVPLLAMPVSYDTLVHRNNFAPRWETYPCLERSTQLPMDIFVICHSIL